jgi:hypothetical protein
MLTRTATTTAERLLVILMLIASLKSRHCSRRETSGSLLIVLSTPCHDGPWLFTPTGSPQPFGLSFSKSGALIRQFRRDEHNSGTRQQRTTGMQQF